MRSKWKGFFITNYIYNEIFLNLKKNLFITNKAIKINSKMLNKNFYIYNGIDWIKIFLNNYSLEKKFGEFILTRYYLTHLKKKKK